MRSVFYCCLPLYIMTGMVAVREERNCFFEAVRDLLNLKTMVGYESDIKLYCPDLDNIKICWKENLQCFNAELNVLTVEFDGGSKQKVTQLIAKLKERFDVHLSYINISKGCEHCETYEEQPVATFLSNLIAFMQYRIKNGCPLR